MTWRFMSVFMPEVKVAMLFEEEIVLVIESNMLMIN